MPFVKTNVCRILDAAKIDYKGFTYTVHEELDAVTVARSLGVKPEQVFKTLVLQGNLLPYFVVIVQGTKELDLKETALQTGNKSCTMLPQKDLLKVTGYIRGGCSPIGMKKKFPTFLDSSAQEFPSIYISPGLRGQQILIKPDDLLRITEGRYITILSDTY